MKTLTCLFIALTLIISGCSDSGDSPTMSGGNSGGTPSLSVSGLSVIEGQSSVMTITLSAMATSIVVFDYTTSNGSAVSGTDYTATTGTDSIMAGMTSTTINVSTTDDVALEIAKNFNFTISNPTNATIGTASVQVSLYDNDGTTFSSEVRPILTASCAIGGCHGTGSSSGGMTMGSATHAAIIAASGSNGNIVVPGNSASSNIYLKTTTTPPFLSRMPLGGPFLSLTDQQKIRDWIDQGAQPN